MRLEEPMVYLKDEQIAKLRAENARLREALARLEGFAKPTCEKGLCTEPATRTAVYSHEGKEVARMNSCDAHGGRTVGPPRRALLRMVDELRAKFDASAIIQTSQPATELAAIRYRATEEGADREVFTDRDALLRMVDELTLAIGIDAETIQQQQFHISELRAERDELRAKLAEAEKCSANVACEKAFAEQGARLRAEEARVKHLEQEVAWRQAQIEGRLR